MKRRNSRIMMLVLLGALFLSASSIYAETAEEYCNRGLTYAKQGNFTQAISDCNKAIEINPNFAETYYDRGNDYDNQGNFSQAIFDFDETIKINPNFA